MALEKERPPSSSDRSKELSTTSPPSPKEPEVLAQTEKDESHVTSAAKEQDPIPAVVPPADAEAVEQDENVEYPGGWHMAVLTFGLVMAVFVVALDNTILATAIPKITTVFDSLNDVGWYGSSYLLTQTSLQPSFGKVYTYFNVKWTFLLSLCIFELGSIICAAARNSPMLIVGRAVAGVGSAAIFSGGVTIIAYSVPLRRRPIYIACIGSVFGVASVIGPLLGGAFTDKLTWRWCFWINLPVGAVGLLTVFFFFKNPKRDHTDMTLRQKIDQIDLLGAFFLIACITCLLLALQWGGTVYAWNNSKVFGNIIGFGLLLIVFLAIQFKRGDKATIPPRIFLRQRTVLATSWYSLFLVMGLYVHIFYIPFYFQAVKGTSAVGSGIRNIPLLASVSIGSLISGALVTKVGYYMPFLSFGAALFTIGAGLIFTWQVDTNSARWIGYQVVAGIGCGIGVQLPFIAVQTVLKPKDVPVGNAISIFFNTLGGAFSISIAQNIFSNKLVQTIPVKAPGVNAQAVLTAGATHVKEAVSKENLQGVLEAYSYALDQAFILPIAVGAVAFIISFFVEWKSVKGKSPLAAAAA